MPLVAGLLAYAGFPIVWAIGDHDGQLTDPGGAAVAFGVVAAVFGLVVTVAGAVPFALWLRRRGPVSIGHAIAAGLVLGNAPFAFYLVGLVLPATLKHLAMGTMSRHLVPLSDLIAGTLRVVAIGSVLGTCSALAFWWLGGRTIAVRHDEGDRLSLLSGTTSETIHDSRPGSEQPLR
jgi:hypothetical protein